MCQKLRIFSSAHACDSVKENIEGDANLHHPARNRVNVIGLMFCLIQGFVTPNFPD